MIVSALHIVHSEDRSLLDELLRHQPFGEVKAVVCDSSYRPPTGSFQVINVRFNFMWWWRAEAALVRASRQWPGERVLCIGGLPPFFRLSNRTIVYLRRASLIPGVKSAAGQIGLKIHYWLERLWGLALNQHADEYWVESEAMWLKMAQTELAERTAVKPFLNPGVQVNVYKGTA